MRNGDLESADSHQKPFHDGRKVADPRSKTLFMVVIKKQGYVVGRRGQNGRENMKWIAESGPGRKTFSRRQSQTNVSATGVVKTKKKELTQSPLPNEIFVRAPSFDAP